MNVVSTAVIGSIILIMAMGESITILSGFSSPSTEGFRAMFSRYQLFWCGFFVMHILQDLKDATGTEISQLLQTTL